MYILYVNIAVCIEKNRDISEKRNEKRTLKLQRKVEKQVNRERR